MSLLDDIAGDAETVFLNESDFAQEIVRYPQGDTSRAVDVVGVLEQANEVGGGNVPGSDAEPVVSKGGKRIVRYAKLWVNATTETHVDDEWLVDGDRWKAVRPIERNPAMVCWLLRHDEMHNTSARRGG